MSAPGIPLFGTLTLSGTQAIVLKAGTYTIEYDTIGREGGVVEYLGKPQTRIELNGIDYESGADVRMAQLSGYIRQFTNLFVPSFIPGYAFFNAAVYVEKINASYEAGHGYPYYTWRITTVLSGGFTIQYGAFDPISFDNAQSGYSFDTVELS